MKQFIYTILMLIVASTDVSAQSETKSFDVDGIKVIFKPTSKNIVNIRLYYRGGVTNYPAEKAGIENLALNAATTCGTSRYSATAFKDTSDKYDILLSGFSTYDYGYIQVNCVSKYFNKAWDFFSESVLNPAFEENELGLLKDRMIASVKTIESKPDERLRNLLMSNAFKNTPYTTPPEGTEQTVNKLTGDDLKRYYISLLNKNKIFIVAAGNITKEELTEKILESFGNLPSRAYLLPDYKDPVWNDNKIATEQSELPINYISAVMNSPGMTNIDYIPFRLGLEGLGGNINGKLQRELNLSYSQGTKLEDLRMPYAIMFATTKKPLEAMQAMVTTLKAIQAGRMDEEWLQHLKGTYLTGNYIDNQSAADICNSLGHAEIMGGWQYADDLPQLVKMATVEQVNKALSFYILGLRWNYLGNTKIIEGAKIPSY